MFSTRKRYLCAPFTFNAPIQKLSQMKFDQPSQRSQPSRAQLDVAGFQTSSVIGYRLSFIFLLVCLSLCVCELCVTVPLSPFLLSLGWLLNSSSTAAAWAICDLRYTIYTRLSIQPNNNYPPRQRMCVCIWYLPTRIRLHVYDYDKCNCNTLNTSLYVIQTTHNET